MNLVQLYERKVDGVFVDPRYVAALYELMAEAQPHEVISHQVMPTMENHVAYVMSRPHPFWYMIEHEATDVTQLYPTILGYIYLSARDEIGLRLYRAHQGRGVGTWAVQELMQLHGKRGYLANIAPGNKASTRMFQRLGFAHIQNTYALG